MFSYFSSESVTEGHPDKVCDRISDSVLDALLSQDPSSRCACECTATPGLITLMGEVTSEARINYEDVAREALREIGYDEYAKNAEIRCYIHSQSPDISGAVTKDDGALGAGDQGIMFGYAVNETESLMPLSYVCATTLAKDLAGLRKSGKYPWILPDGKTQVTLKYEDGKVAGVSCVIVSTQHTEDITQEKIAEILKKDLIFPVLNGFNLDYSDCAFLINPSGRFVLGGPDADSGLTGRKIIVDTYGGASRHGGGAFSGKDPSKVDRSAAYMARKIAKTIVSSGAASRCEIQLAYAIGIEKPVSVFVETFGTGKLSDCELRDWVVSEFDLSPASIINSLGLKRPIYKALSSYGHFGRTDALLPWEEVSSSQINKLKKLF